MDIEHVRVQYGVGQGSFHAAHVSIIHNSHYRFDYVYDCGGMSGPVPSQALARCIRHYLPRREKCDGGKRGEERTIIDLLVISHFDFDHLMGARELAARHQIERVVVPYLSPLELLLEVARQVDANSLTAVEEVFSIAHGGDLWGIPTTRVIGGSVAGNDDDRPVETSQPGAEDFNAQSNPEVVRTSANFPLPMSAIVESTGLPLGSSISDRDAVLVRAETYSAWRFRFWNQGGTEEIAMSIAVLLAEVGFPLDALEQPDGAAEVFEWLRDRQNRDLLVEAYALALGLGDEELIGDVKEKAFANRLSLALLSTASRRTHGEDDRRWRYATYPQSASLQYPFRTPYFGRIGWLGTGDAPLGDAKVWSDFSLRFGKDLGFVQTILLPHHGAAPRTGDTFFNRELLENFGVNAVISVGTQNSHKHPRTSVVQAALMRGAAVHIVTEDTWPGFVETAWTHIKI